MSRLLSRIKARGTAAEADTPVAGDVNGDGKVDKKDLSIVHKEYAKEEKRKEQEEADKDISLDVADEDEMKVKNKKKGKKGIFGRTVTKG